MLMKTSYKMIIAIAAVLAIVSCKGNDATADYGFPLVYIPQATVTGLDDSYPIPSGPFYRNSAYSAYVDGNTLNIAVGVIRSGYFSHNRAYSVSLGVSDTRTARKIAEYDEKGTPAQAMPFPAVTIPSRIEAPEGKTGGTCYVGVDLEALAAVRPTLMDSGVYKLLVLGLEISDLQGPSEYSLAESNTSVVIVLDLGSSEWDAVDPDKPEARVRTLFPL